MIKLRIKNFALHLIQQKVYLNININIFMNNILKYTSNI
jgi:hypothetical protein